LFCFKDHLSLPLDVCASNGNPLVICLYTNDLFSGVTEYPINQSSFLSCTGQSFCRKKGEKKSSLVVVNGTKSIRQQRCISQIETKAFFI